MDKWVLAVAAFVIGFMAGVFFTCWADCRIVIS